LQNLSTPKKLFSTLLKWVKPAVKGSSNLSPRPGQSQDMQNEDALMNLPGIDVESGLKRVGGNRQLYRKLLLKFSQEYSDAANQIRKDLLRGDIKNAEMLAHTIKGTAGSIGAQELTASAGDLEGAIRERKKDRYEELLRQFAQTQDKTMSSLAHLDSRKNDLDSDQVVNLNLQSSNELGNEEIGSQAETSEVLLESLKSLEPHLKTGKPKKCAEAMKKICQLCWPADLNKDIEELEMTLGKYKFKEASVIIESLTTKLNKSRAIDG